MTITRTPPPSAGSGGAGRAWAPSTVYKAGDLVTQAGAAYRANTDFTSGASFNAANWTAVGGATLASVDGGAAATTFTGADFIDGGTA